MSVKNNQICAGTYNGIGQILNKSGMLSSAIKEFKKGLELEPSNEVSHYNLGKSYYVQGKYDDAIAELREALKTNPKNDDAHCELGYILDIKGLWQEAEDEYRKAIMINPKNNYAQKYLLVVMDKLKKYSSEKEIIKEIVKMPCKYCGTLIENTSLKCPICGAPVS